MSKPKLVDVRNVRCVLQREGKWFQSEIDEIMEVISRMVPAYDTDETVKKLSKLKAGETPEWNDGYYSAISDAIRIVRGEER